MSFVLPFNYQPTSVSVKTSSYTIPAGSYARVQVQVINGGTFTIDGTTCLQSLAATAGDVNAVDVNTSSNNATLFTVTAGYRFEGQVYVSGWTSINIAVGGEVVEDLNAGGFINIKAADGQAIAVSSGSGTGSTTLTGYEIREHKSATHAELDIWLPTGTVINGTGDWAATVSLFNEIT